MAMQAVAVLAVSLSVREFWAFYRGYTKSAVHTATAATLAVFGLLVFIDPLFALVAIASDVLPPPILYAIGASVGEADDSPPTGSIQSVQAAGSDRDSISPIQRSGWEFGTETDGRDGDTTKGQSDTATGHYRLNHVFGRDAGARAI